MNRKNNLDNLQSVHQDLYSKVTNPDPDPDRQNWVCIRSTINLSDSSGFVLIYIRWSEIDSDVWRQLGIFICLRQLLRSRELQIWHLFPKSLGFLHTCVSCSELPSYTGSMNNSIELHACFRQNELRYLKHCSTIHLKGVQKKTKRLTFFLITSTFLNILSWNLMG